MSYQDFIDANKQMSEEIDNLLRVVRAAQKLTETENGILKYVKVEGVGDIWRIPEVLGLALFEALEALPEHLRETKDATTTDTQNQ